MKAAVLTMSLALAALGATSANAETVKFEGCAVKVFGEVCTIINPVGQSYVVNSATPAIPTGTRVRLIGVKDMEPTICGMPALRNIKWRKVRGGCN